MYLEWVVISLVAKSKIAVGVVSAAGWRALSACCGGEGDEERDGCDY